MRFSSVLVILAVAGAAFGGCLEDAGLLQSSLNCTGLPTIQKYFDPQTFHWNGKDYLAYNTGNDLKLWNVTDPHTPVGGAASHFNVGNMGDSDYDLLNYSICDDCRYGVATYKLGTVLFDIGVGPTPVFGARAFHGTSSDPRGAFTFKYGDTQYLLANYLPDDCGGDATVYRYGGVNDIQPIGCLDVPGFTGKFINGVMIDGDYLYLGFYDNWIYVYRVQDGGALTFLSKSPIRASMARGKGLAVDHTAELAVSSFVNDGMHVWDITNPIAPVERASVAGNLGLAAARYPFAWVAQPLNLGSERSFDIRGHLTEIDAGFWSPSNQWNSHASCEYPTGGVFVGDVLFLTRYAVVQAIDFSACLIEPPLFADGFESGDTSAWSS